MISRFEVQDQGQEVAPLHKAPWVGTDEVMPPDAAPHLARLGGDFFCAPFGLEQDGAPLHGWPANAPWAVTSQTASHLTATLEHRVFGATVTKELTLLPGHPFVYQRHVFSGGAGQVPVANHANVALPNGGMIRTSAKASWHSPGAPPESDPARGRSVLSYPARTHDMHRFPTPAGTVDLGRYPWSVGSEEFVAGLAPKGSGFGWTAVTRPTQGDLFLSLRREDQLPMTMLWHSNGGRDYAPWSGRHLGCLGVEEGAAGYMIDGPDYASGVTLDPDRDVSVGHVIGALHWPSRDAVVSVGCEGGQLIVTGQGGATRRVPFEMSTLTLDD